MKQSTKPYFVYPPVATLALYISVLGSLIPAIRSAFPGLTLAESGLFSTLQSVGTMLSVMLCFCVFSALNKARVMAISSFLLAMCMVLFGVNRLLLLLYALFFFIGLFSNAVDTLSNALLADLAPERKGFHIGLLQALWAAGAAAGPYFAILLGSEYPPVFIGLGVVTALAAFIFAAGLSREMRMPMMQRQQNFGAVHKLLRTLKLKGMGPIVLTSFFNSFVQIGIIFFISSYIIGAGGDKYGAAFTMSMIFVGSLIGRVCYARLIRRLSVRVIMMTSNALAVAAFTAMLFCPNPVWAGILAAIGGIGIAPNFPALIVEACTIVPEDTAAGSSLVFLGYAAACFIAPPVIGAIGDTAGLKTALFCATGLLVVVVALSSMLRRRPA